MTAMVKRKRAPVQPLPEGWARLDEYRISERRLLTRGTQVKITGVRGKVLTFVDATRTGDGRVWLNFQDQDGRFREFYPDRVARVLRSNGDDHDH